MSKKLIAVASAAALALSALVAVPASALPFGETGVSGNSITVSETGDRLTGGSGSFSSPYTVKVPDNGLADWGTTTSNLVRFSLSSDVKSRAFTVKSTAGIKLLDAAATTTNAYTAASGAATLSVTTNASGVAEFFAFPTSTTKGYIEVNLDGDITQIYMTGEEGQAYDIGTVTFPTLDTKGVGAVVVVVTDAFGNPIVTGTPTITTTLVGTGSPSVTTAVAYSTTTKRFEGVLTAGSSAGQLAVGMSMATSESTARKAAFGDPNNTAFGIIQVAAAKTAAEWGAMVAALQAQLAISRLVADSVTQKKYNTLARKWNAAFPSKKVALKK
jgi:hypothetical protein